MRARMEIRWRGIRFSDAERRSGEVIATGEDSGTPVSNEEMKYHLEAGHAKPLKGSDEVSTPEGGEQATESAPEEARPAKKPTARKPAPKKSAPAKKPAAAAARKQPSKKG